VLRGNGFSRIFHDAAARLLATALLLSSAVLHAETRTEPLASLVEQITQKLRAEYPEKPLEHVSADADYLDFVVRDRLDARLLEGNPLIQGGNLYFTQPYLSHAASVITLTYATGDMALQQAQRLPGNGQENKQYLRKTKVLAPFIHMIMDNTVVILFSEKQTVVPLLKALVQTLDNKQAIP